MSKIDFSWFETDIGSTILKSVKSADNKLKRFGIFMLPKRWSFFCLKKCAKHRLIMKRAARKTNFGRSIFTIRRKKLQNNGHRKVVQWQNNIY
jgi:hypothetical protein